jgi:hypothetical protein
VKIRTKLTKLDSNQNIFFSRQLEDIDDKSYEVLFAGMLARRYIPQIEGVPEWANSHTFRMYEMVGTAKIVGPNSNDLPRVGVKAAEKSRIIKQLADSYSWTVREIQQAAATGAPLDEMTVLAARTAIARLVDDLLASGDSTNGIEGLLNLTGVNTSTATTKTGGGTNWLSAGCTPDEILKDLNLIISDTRAALKQADNQIPQFARFTILLPSLNYQKVATTARSSTSDTTILKFFLENNPWVESVEEWYKCDTGASGGGTRAVCFPRTPLWGGSLIPQEFSALPPQESGLDIIVPCTATCGGVITRYPVAARYMDAIGAT